MHCGRFVERNNVYGLIKTAEKSYESLIDCAVQCLSYAREAHFRLEALYGNAMDFKLKDEHDKHVVKVVSDIIL